MVEKGDEGGFITLLVITILSIIFGIIKIKKDKYKFKSLIESELAVFNLELIDINKPNWYDTIPSFPEKISFTNFITNDAGKAYPTRINTLRRV